LFWLARQQKWLLLGNAFFGIGWMLCMALIWAAVGAGIDHGVVPHHFGVLLAWGGVVALLGITQAICGALRHQLAVTNWMTACYRTIQLVGRRMVAAGTAVTDKVPSGDIVNTVGADAARIGGAFDVLARFIGSVVSWLVVSFLLLSTSLQLGLIVLLGVPILASLTTPLMRPLHRSQASQREESGRLAALGSDTVVGLRILRGVGGEDVFFSNYEQQSHRVRGAGNRVAGPQAGLESGQIFLPAVLTVFVTFVGAHSVMKGTLQPGQLVTFFGYANFLTTPLRTAIEYVMATTRAYVGAGKVLRILTTPPLIADGPTLTPWPSSPGVLRDAVSGLTLTPGDFCALVTETPSEATVLMDRLGRFTPHATGVTLGGVPLTAFSVSDTRRHIVVSEIEPRLFSGRLRHELDPHSRASDDDIAAALFSASASDILEALDTGYETHVEERGRSFSGGQRQRLALVRALVADAEYLLLVEPTSAVDAHTEGRIAARLPLARQGRATMIASTSPLILEKTSRVIFAQDGRVVDEGTHTELLARSAAYRHVVLREDA
jgi:ABC-type multidrug transport system fused ATPase/permease subunit